MDVHRAIVISQADTRPMYVQIMEQIRQLVAVGDWAPGQEIPSIRQLAVDLRVSVITVKRAYLELERQGVIVTRQGKGSFVAAGAGLAPRLLEQDLEQHLRQALHLAAQLGLAPDELAARLRGGTAAAPANATTKQDD
jgi:GntR family transcriptional regulator